jgi:hypothetical protein
MAEETPDVVVAALRALLARGGGQAREPDARVE